jgi:4-hydroxy-tetrahydrodipicolinate synthase
MFCETSPGPVKYAAELLGLCGSHMRLPMVEITEESKQRVESALRTAGILS